MAISSPLLEDVSIDGATGILINITGGPDLTLHEVNEASSLIQQAAHEDANIIFGSVIDPNLSDEVRITVIATGFDRAVAHIEDPMPSMQPERKRATQIAMPYTGVPAAARPHVPPTQSPMRHDQQVEMHDAAGDARAADAPRPDAGDRADAHRRASAAVARRSRRAAEGRPASVGRALRRRGDRARHPGLLAPSAPLRRVASPSRARCRVARVIFLESFARPLMVCHAIAAAVLVGATTHHLLWCRHYLRGSYSRVKAERRFATICAIAFVSTFAAGNLLYPTYKVRVRAEYFDNGAGHRRRGQAARRRPPRVGMSDRRRRRPSCGRCRRSRASSTSRSTGSRSAAWRASRCGFFRASSTPRTSRACCRSTSAVGGAVRDGVARRRRRAGDRVVPRRRRTGVKPNAFCTACARGDHRLRDPVHAADLRAPATHLLRSARPSLVRRVDARRRCRWATTDRSCGASPARSSPAVA